MGQRRHSLGLGAFLGGVLDVSLVMSRAVISLNCLSIRGGWKTRFIFPWQKVLL